VSWDRFWVCEPGKVKGEMKALRLNQTSNPMSDQLPPSVVPPAVPPAKKIPGLAIAGLILGIISVMGAAILVIPTVLAIVFGHVSLSRIKRDPRLTGNGIAIASFVLGYVSIVFGVMMAGLLAAMAIPAFQKVREQSLRTAMANDARQIADAAHQVMLAKGERPITFQIDPQTGNVSGPLSEYVKHITPGTREVDGTIENATDTFSLQNPHVSHGQEMTYDADGRLK